MPEVSEILRAPAMADWIRVVPEVAARIALGARVMPDGSAIEFESCRTDLEPEALGMAIEIAQSLPKPSGRVVGATYILQTRFRAEEMFLERIMSQKAEASILFSIISAEHYTLYRAKLPAWHMRQRGRVYAHWTDSLDLGKALRFGILWLQWESSPAIYSLALDAKRHGVKIVYDLDDDFQCAPDWHPMRRSLTPERVEMYWRMIELADCVVVPTKELIRRFEARAKRIEILPYCVPASVLPKRARLDDGIKRILWIGSPSHDGDLQIVAPAILKLLRQDQKVRFCCSFDTEPPGLLKDVAGQIDKIPFCPMEDYYTATAKLGADVAISPLADHPFNQCKTALKYFELGGMGYPYLVSPVAEYPDLFAQGAPLELVDDHRWFEAIGKALYDAGWSESLGLQARQWVARHRDIESCCTLWEDLALSLKEA